MLDTEHAVIETTPYFISIYYPFNSMYSFKNSNDKIINPENETDGEVDIKFKVTHIDTEITKQIVFKRKPLYYKVKIDLEQTTLIDNIYQFPNLTLNRDINYVIYVYNYYNSEEYLGNLDGRLFEKSIVFTTDLYEPLEEYDELVDQIYFQNTGILIEGKFKLHIKPNYTGQHIYGYILFKFPENLETKLYFHQSNTAINPLIYINNCGYYDDENNKIIYDKEYGELRTKSELLNPFAINFASITAVFTD
jgi:hypothetical protein